METVEVNHGISQTIDIAKTAFEVTNGIKTYSQEGNSIIGKTGVSIGSYGEVITAECQESDDGSTVVMVSGEKEVSANITANPDKYVRRYVSNLRKLKNKPTNEVMSIAEQQISQGDSKEVTNPDQQAGGKGIMILVMLLVMFFFIIMMFSI